MNVSKKTAWQLLIKKEKVTIPKSDVENLLNFICSEINIAIECIDDKSYDLAIDKLYDLNEELEGI